MRLLWQIIAEALGNLYGAKQRSLLALIGIVIGTGSVIAMINIGTIVQHEALRQFKELGTNILNLSYSGAPDSSFRLADITGLAAAVPLVEAAAPVALGSGDIRFRGKVESGSLVGATEVLGDLAKFKMARGRFLSDLDQFEPFVVIGDRLASQLTADGSAVELGDPLQIGGHVLQIAGILQPVPYNSLFPTDFSSAAIVTLSSMHRLAPHTGITSIIVRLTSDLEVDQATHQITAYFAPKLRGGQMRVRSAAELIATMQKQMELFTLLLGSIGSIALLVGGIGVMNVMLVSVTERRREIGIRLAIGARRFDIQRLFLVEAVVLSIIGGLVGTAVGVGASAVISELSSWQFILSQSAIPLGAGVSIAVGIFFGFYPAVIASRLNPIEALRSA